MPRFRPDGGDPFAGDDGDDLDATSREPERDAEPDEPERDANGGPAECERRAVALLARREHSRLELERKLEARGFAAGVIAGTLDRLEQKGLLDGQRFMESFIESRVSRGLGPVRIKAELIERGIPSGAAAVALAAAGKDWALLATAARAKRFGSAVPAAFAARTRQARFLEYRGFGGADIRAALESGRDSD